jgi:hypothetical protein
MSDFSASNLTLVEQAEAVKEGERHAGAVLETKMLEWRVEEWLEDRREWAKLFGWVRPGNDPYEWFHVSCFMIHGSL